MSDPALIALTLNELCAENDKGFFYHMQPPAYFCQTRIRIPSLVQGQGCRAKEQTHLACLVQDSQGQADMKLTAEVMIAMRAIVIRVLWLSMFAEDSSHRLTT